MAIRKSSSSGIPFGNTAGRPANPGIGQLYSNGQVGRLELYTSTGWQNIVQETPGIAGVTGTYNESAGSGTFTISGTNFVDGGLVYAVGTNAVEYQATTSTYNSIVQMTAVFSNLSPAYEPYDVKVVNPSNLFGLLPDAFFINDSPVWSTTAGSLGSFGGVTSIQLAATDDESNTITYSVTSGSLPTGLSLSSSGLISGTVTASPATYTFTVSASDGINTAQTRSFSIIVPNPVASGGALSSDSTYYYRTFTSAGTLAVSGSNLNADILVVAGGGGSSVHVNSDGGGGGGGAGGLLYSSSVTMPISSYVVTIGGGGGNQSNGVNTTLIGSSVSLTAIGGGRGGSYNTIAGGNGGSGGGGAGAMGQTLATGTSGQGNNGGYGGNGSPAYGGGGGGGAGAAGGSTSTDTPGIGGVGSLAYSSWGSATSTGHLVSGSYYYAGGGGGGTRSASYSAGPGASGGYGGGGTGAGNQNSNTPSNGTANTGGGAGGTSVIPNTIATGGSGIVIVRYTKASVGG